MPSELGGRLGRWTAVILLLILGWGVAWGEQAGAKRGDVLFTADFEATDALKGWSGDGVPGDGYQGKRGLMLTHKVESGAAMARVKLPAEKMRGCLVYASAMVKADKVSAKPHSWNGIKFMAAIVAPADKLWPQAAVDVGTFEWKRAQFVFRVPSDATDVTLCLGLEAVSGTVWFDEVRIAVRKPPTKPAAPVAAGEKYTGHAWPRLRGAMISPNIDEAGLRTLGQAWNANLIRWQLVNNSGTKDSKTPAEYQEWLEKELKKLDAALPLCEKYGLMVVVDLHSPPGGKRTSAGYVGAEGSLFTDRLWQDEFVAVWQKMARRYKGQKMIWGYDLVNEPVESELGETVDDWHDLAERAAKAVRAIDDKVAIIVEPPEGGGPQAMKEFVPIDVKGVVYSVHMYMPGTFTHQGVHGRPVGVEYPGMIEGKKWDKEAVELALKPAVDFQKKYNVQIYVGEFSAIRWAPNGSSARYLRDAIDVFEKYQWDWSYHAFREWQGWSAEWDEDPASKSPATAPTARQTLLTSWFAQNQKPAK